MTTEQKIKMAVAYRGMSSSALARALDMTPQNFNRKLKIDTVSDELMEKICKILGAKHYSFFEFPDGVRVGDSPSR